MSTEGSPHPDVSPCKICTIVAGSKDCTRPTFACPIESHATSQPHGHISAHLVLCPVVDLLHPAKELDGRPSLLGHVVAQLDVLALYWDGQKIELSSFCKIRNCFFTVLSCAWGTSMRGIEVAQKYSVSSGAKAEWFHDSILKFKLNHKINLPVLRYRRSIFAQPLSLGSTYVITL